MRAAEQREGVLRSPDSHRSPAKDATLATISHFEVRMTKLAPAPALLTSEEADRLVAERAKELEAIRSTIASAQAELSALAMDPDESKFEAKSLEIHRLQLRETRAEARLEEARKAPTEARHREEQARRHTLYSAGQKAATEAEKLAGEYAKHAGAIADIFRKIEMLRRPVEAANAALPEGEDVIDVYRPFEIHLYTSLPAATEGSEDIWWKAHQWRPGPLDTAEPNFVPRIVTIEPAVPQPEKPHEPQLLEGGGRKFTMPACEWPGAAR